MVSAITTAVNGLNNASKQLEISAKQIASASTNTGNQTQPPVDVEKALINTNIESYNFKADLKVIQAADDNFKSLLDIKT